QAEDGIRDWSVTGVQTCALPILIEASKMGLSPREIMNLVPYVVPGSLPYTIPVSLLFSVTVVYGRLASDNEIVAVKTAGLSAWKIGRASCRERGGRGGCGRS